MEYVYLCGLVPGPCQCTTTDNTDRKYECLSRLFTNLKSAQGCVSVYTRGYLLKYYIRSHQNAVKQTLIFMFFNSKLRKMSISIGLGITSTMEYDGIKSSLLSTTGVLI